MLVVILFLVMVIRVPPRARRVFVVSLIRTNNQVVVLSLAAGHQNQQPVVAPVVSSSCPS